MLERWRSILERTSATKLRTKRSRCHLPSTEACTWKTLQQFVWSIISDWRHRAKHMNSCVNFGWIQCWNAFQQAKYGLGWFDEGLDTVMRIIPNVNSCVDFFSAMASAIKHPLRIPILWELWSPSIRTMFLTNGSEHNEHVKQPWILPWTKSPAMSSVQVGVSGIFLPLYAIVLTRPPTNWLCWWWKWHAFTPQKCHTSAKLHEIEGWFNTSQDSTVGQWINWIIYIYMYR